MSARPYARVSVDLPKLNSADRLACARYRVSQRALRSSWAATVRWYAEHYGHVRCDVVVRRTPTGEPRWHACGVSVELPWVPIAAMWLAQVGTIALIDGAARARARGRGRR